ncbi:L-aspartate oxidase [Halobacillus seohaensis]|uniref:L-aspartate oxidase n=1 Tax=Halobacillus seohaensis TaxID=447421 RepID=A0ABW2EQK6_9BACI
MIKTDILVIGSGAAGLASSVYAAASNQSILVIDKGGVGKSGSTVGAVQMASLGHWSDSEDSEYAYRQDIHESGRGLSNRALTGVLANEISARMEDLLHWGLKLDRNEQNDILVSSTSGHTIPRSISSKKGKTGLGILQTLTKKAKSYSNLETWSDVITLELVKSQGRIVGAVVLDLTENLPYLIQSKAVILATGGMGQLYPITSNPAQATGDGFSLCLEAGASLIDMEQIQFYPVSLIEPRSLSGLCMSFHHMAKLYNSKGERFMSKYEPKTMENTTRDKLAIAIASEVEAGFGTDHGGVWIDVSENIDEVKKQFFHEYKLCLDRGIDLANQQAEVAPAAHFMMGGAQIDSNAASTVPGLYVAGETTGGLHGGNRLGNNALSECIVFGARAGGSAGKEAKLNPLIPTIIPLQTKKTEDILMHISDGGYGSERSYECKDQVRTIMGGYVGVVRSTEGLLQAKDQLITVQNKLKNVKITSSNGQYSKEIIDYIEAIHMVQTALAIIESAIHREESRGAHYTIDFPAQLIEAKHAVVSITNKKLNCRMIPMEGEEE